MDVSLYQLALNAEPSLQPLLISPATIKSFVESLLDLLSDQQIPAKLWIKLPPSEVWQTEMQQQWQRVKVPHTIYLCNPKPKLVEALHSEPNPISPMIPLRLTGGSQLKREFFILVLAEQFCGVILVSQPHSPKLVGAKTARKKPQPITLCSFNPKTVQRVLEGIQTSLSTSSTTSSEFPTLQASLLEGAPSSEGFLNQLLVKQLQRQEELQEAEITPTAVPMLGEFQQMLRLKDEFMSHVVQELRTPLTNMKTALSLLESAQLKPAQRQRYMQLLHTQCDRQTSLLSGLLELIQLDRTTDQHHLQPLHLGDIVPGVVSTYQPLAQEKGIQLGYTVPSNLPPITCSEGWLKQIVINLLHNSIKYTPQGGQASVRASVQGDYVQLEFRDTGIGISANEIPQIFDRFYRGRSAPGEEATGAGLGLTIVQQLLLRCGGSISVSSKPNEGSTFKVLLPIAEKKN